MTSLTKALRKIAFARHQKLFLSRPKRTFHNCPSQCRFSSVSSTLDGALDGLYSLLNYKERAILEEQRRLTETSRKLASQVGGDKVSDLLHNTQSLHFLTDLNLQSTFSVAIAGEFNAGKSTIVNALLGSSLLESGSLPTTDTITIVAANQLSKRDDKATESVDDDAATNNLPLGVSLHSMQDLPLLQDLTFIDTPGTNSAWIDHTERTLRLLPSADLILFVTSADRPFSDSERSLLKNIQAYRKSIVIVINKMDILEENGYTEGAEKIINFVTDNASELLGARPIVIPVSGRNALKAKLEMKALPDKSADFSAHSDLKRAWKESNFASLESFLRDSLTTETRIRSKLTSPIGVAEGIMAQCLKTLKVEKKELQADNAALHLLKSQFDGWTKELSSDLNGINKSIAAIVEMEGQQGELVLSRINLYNFYAWTLTGSTANLEREWEETKRQSSLHRQQDLETELLDQVHEMADSVASRGRSQQQVVMEYLGNRPTMKHLSLIGSVTATSRFEDTRKALDSRMSNTVKNILEGRNNNNREKEYLFISLNQLATASCVFQMAAVGTGIVSTATSVIDPIMGLVTSSSLFMGGIAFYWLGLSRLANNYQKQWTEKAKQLEYALNIISSKELEKVNKRIMDGVGPYKRFVENEQGRIDQLRDECEGLAAAARSLRTNIGNLSESK